MGADSFVHLHLHTSFSLLDGAVRIKEVMKKAVEHEMPAIAITDHGNLFGAIDFYQAAKKEGVKPIIGCETYMAPGSMLEKKASSASEAAFHFTLLAKDETGYKNLVKLVSAAHLDGFYYKPRIDKELLAKHAKGLIGMSGCLKGEVNQAILSDRMQEARDTVATFRDILGAENYFLELHNHGIEAQQKCNAHLPALAREFGLGLVAANDVHFLERSHHEAHDVMICIGTGANVADEKRMRYVPELYFKSPAEMRALFADHPDAVANTLTIADRCNLELEFGKPKYPNYTPPEGLTQEEYLDQICEKGLRQRYGAQSDSAEIQERLAREIGLLRKLGFVNYFLITWDFIHWAKQQGIPVGPGRGSAAGSMVAYVMGITDIDPIKFKLLFERFLNPERVSPPDIDVDFCMNRRGEVIDYVRDKYGERAVSQIITFGTLGAKSVVRDVGRVLGWSYGDADRVAKMIPNELNITLADALAKNPDLKNAVENEPATRQLWEYSTVLEGLSRNSGVHAAGVVISDRDLSEYIPLARTNDGSIVSQYSMSPLTDLGMLKMDFLGLKTLTVIQDAVQLIKEKVPEFDIALIPTADQATFDLINRGETIAVFQLESGGMINVCKQFDVADIEDINAILALYRPGPMDLIPDYIKRKKGKARIKYAHPLLEQVCGDTYGIFVYQEQVIQAVQVMAGYSLGGADLLRRAMGKKDKEKMAQERVKFIEGAKTAHNIGEEKAAEVFDLLEKFAGYGFNRSHSAAYAWVSYQTAFLKANYPVEFMAAVMSNEVRNTDKISIFVGECKRMGMEILPPDVNRSGLKFLPEISHEKVGIRFGLAAIKNVGEGAMQAAIEEREAGGEFKSMEDFCRRVDTRKANKKVIEALVKCGAFDFTGEDRAALFARVDGAIAAAASAHRDRLAGQVSLFGDMMEEEAAAPPERSVHVASWPLSDKLMHEKELLGFYVTGHPLDEYAGLIGEGKYVPIHDLATQEDKATVAIAGMIQVLDKKFTKKDGKPFAILTLEDLTGSLEVMVWNETYSRCASVLEKGNVVALTGRLDLRDEGVRLAANEVSIIELKRSAPKPLRLKLRCDRVTEQDLQTIRSAVEEFPGVAPLELFFFRPDGQRARLTAGRQFSVDFQPALKERLSAWL